MKTLLESILGKNMNKLEPITVDGKKWYRAKALCQVLGLRNTSVAVRGTRVHIGYFGVDRKDVFKLGGYRNSPLYLSEYGVFMLILKSRKPAAYAVKSMLSEEILPTIFRTAMYWVFPEPKTSADSEAGVSSEASEVA